MQRFEPGSTIGILGGGQLGRMLALAAAELGYRCHIFTPEEDSPASQVAAKTFVAPYTDTKALTAFANSVDVITYEFENIPAESIDLLTSLKSVRPGRKALEISQHRLREKQFLRSIGVPTAPFSEVQKKADLASAYASLESESAILKTTRFGYDGKGQYRLKSQKDIDSLPLDEAAAPWVLEGFVSFAKEVSAIVARNEKGETCVFEPAENVHKEGILATSSVPAAIAEDTAEEAAGLAVKIAAALEVVGLLAVEFFMLPSGSLVVNELAPRPHNSGHWTMNGAMTCQFEQHIRAVCGLPFGNPARLHPTQMINLIGEDVKRWKEFSSNPNAKIHLYGKSEIRPGRKMGHVNIIGG